MLVRIMALCVALLVGIGIIVPLGTNDADAASRRARKQRKHRKHYKKYSKRWWRQYRARQRRARRHRAQVRRLRLRQIRLAKARRARAANRHRVASRSRVKRVRPASSAAPQTWAETQASSNELRFRVDDSRGSQVGSASISVVGPASGEDRTIGSHKMIAGVATTALRRDVINRMIQENGWVVNDYQKEINGRLVYVVVAQSQARNGQLQSRMFYFTAVDGKIYNVATNSSADQADRLAEESEKVLGSLQSRVRSTQRASVRE